MFKFEQLGAKAPLWPTMMFRSLIDSMKPLIPAKARNERKTPA
jgi:hypothetical protein